MELFPIGRNQVLGVIASHNLRLGCNLKKPENAVTRQKNAQDHDCINAAPGVDHPGIYNRAVVEKSISNKSAGHWYKLASAILMLGLVPGGVQLAATGTIDFIPGVIFAGAFYAAARCLARASPFEAKREKATDLIDTLNHWGPKIREEWDKGFLPGN